METETILTKKLKRAMKAKNMRPVDLLMAAGMFSDNGVLIPLDRIEMVIEMALNEGRKAGGAFAPIYSFWWSVSSICETLGEHS